MEQERNKRKRNINGKTALVAVMIGFCILALIEIAYGQAQLKVEKERLALEETNYQTLQALEKVQEDAKSGQTVSDVPETTQDSSFMNVVGKDAKKADTENAGQLSDEEQSSQDGAEDEKEYDMQIVFMGDSLLDHVRDYDGIAALIGDACNADVYNMSMGGTTAALLPGEDAYYETWDSRCLLGVVNAILGNIDTSLFDGYRAGEILEECDFSKTDYFVIEYGVNDFMANIPPSRHLENGEMRNEDDLHTYVGALDTAIALLHGEFPNARFLVIAPHYCQFFDAGRFLGDGYSFDNGYGKLVDYSRVCGYVANEHRENGAIFYNAFEESGIDAYSAEDCLADGIHLTAEGRRRYAEVASRIIMADFYPEE